MDAALKGDTNGPKVNNSWVALMARELAESDPAFKTFFEFRQRRAG